MTSPCCRQRSIGSDVFGSRTRAAVGGSEAWDSLAAELGFAASGYGSALAELTSNAWVGPTSVAMISAVTPYINWLTSTGAQAEETANHARAAVAAYEAAFAMTVPPPVIAANRALLAALVATNFLVEHPRDRSMKPCMPKCGPRTPRPCTATRAPRWLPRR